MSPERFANHNHPVLPRLLTVAMFAWAISGLTTVRAELTWKQKTIEISPDAKTALIEARFPFTNEGSTAVDIEDIQTSCGCTTAELKQRHYEPGQGGELVTQYTIGDHVGLQRKTVVVTTADHKDTVLTIVARVPELLHIEPTSVTWKPGEAGTAKMIQLTASPADLTLENLSVEASNTRVTAVLRPVVEGSKYELQVTPDTTDKPALVTLLIRSRLGTKENTFHAYATVQQTSPAAVPPPSALPSPSPATTAQ